MILISAPSRLKHEDQAGGLTVKVGQLVTAVFMVIPAEREISDQTLQEKEGGEEGEEG